MFFIKNETATMEKLMAASYKKNIGQDEDHVEYKKGPPVFYPTGKRPIRRI